MHIEITIREIYGEKKAYPHCEKAKLFAAMLNTKTLTHSALIHIERLGYEIKTAQEIQSWKH